MNILVTGGTGFIGEHFIPLLQREGHKVRLLVRDLEKARSKFGDSCEYHVSDIMDAKGLQKCCENIDIVYHMVAKVGNELPSEEAFEEFRKINVEGTKNIVNECQTANIKKFIFVSSIAAMGIVQSTPISETSKCSPYLPYQVSKYEAEQYILKEYIEKGFPAVILRPTKVYGVGEREFSYLTLLKIHKLGFFIKVGRGQNSISNIYISDLVEFLLRFSKKGIVGECYILTSKESIKFIDLRKIFSETLNRNSIIIYIPSILMITMAMFIENSMCFIKRKPVVTKKNIEAITTNRIYDISKAIQETGYEPQVTLETGIRNTVSWYIKNKMI